LGKVSAQTFGAGDQIYFKAGESWTGELDLNGNGTLANPIVVDRYGSGTKPLINGGGYESAVRLQGVSYWEVNNLELINDGGPTLSGPAVYRAGVLVKSAFTAARSHIYLRNLTIHDIFPETGPYGHGIHVLAECSSSVDTYYDDVRIENCHISRTGRFGVWVQQTGSTLADPAYRYIRNVMIRSNLFENVGGSGAETGWCDGVLLEHNVVQNSGASVDPRQWARGSGYWPFKCRNVLVQFNEFRHARGEADSCGVHIDYGNRDVTIQYNLSLDNEGGFVEILGDNVNSIYRYNVSINDGARIKGVNGASQDGHLIWLSDYVGGGPGVGATNSQIYNNTIYVRPGITNYLKIMERSTDTFIRNNIFHFDGRSVYTNAGTNTEFENNLWHGNLPAGLPLDPDAVFANPALRNAAGTNAADYQLLRGSPAWGAGLTINSNGGFDFWGNALPATSPSIGAHEPTFNLATVISVNLTEFTTTNQQIAGEETFGIASLDSVVGGWTNLNQTLTANFLPLSDATLSTVTLRGTAPNGWASFNAAYNDTPLLGGIEDYTGTATPVSVTMSNLAANFPDGYRVIAYVGGFLSNRGASISDGSTTFYYRPLSAPVAPVAFARTTTTTNLGDSNNPVAQYALFGDRVLLTNDTVTLTLDTLYGGGAMLGGLQILPPPVRTALGVPYAWFARYGLATNDLADADLDGAAAWQEYYAGTTPTNALSSFRVLQVGITNGHFALSWLGGTNGYAGNWSMAVSTNLTDWTMIASQTIPRSPTGTNYWTDPEVNAASQTKFYRPCVEYPH
jgi:hypothetical protein